MEMKRFLFAIAILLPLLMLSACRPAPQLAPPPAAPAAVVLINADGALAESELERVRAFAEVQLNVRVLAEGGSLESASLAGAISESAEIRTDRSPIEIVICELAGQEEHILVDQQLGLAAINTSPIETDDAEQYARRLERLVMRAAGTLAGLGFDPDPFCVMHSYESVADLDRMGRNFSPPWQQKFAQAAAQMGLEAREPQPN
jgi:hypothetical protein